MPPTKDKKLKILSEMPLVKEKKPKTLDELLVLTDNEKKAKDAVKRLAQSGDYFKKVDVYPTLREVSLSSIVRCCELDSEFNDVCRDPNLSECWNIRLAKLMPGARPLTTMEGKTITALDQIKGHYFLRHYDKYIRQNKPESKEARKLLRAAMRYQIFNAYQMKLNFIKSKLFIKKTLMSQKQLLNIVKSAWDAGKTHWAWGYLEAAYLFLNLGAYLSEIAFEANDELLACQAGDRYRDALTCLFLAQRLEFIEHSKNAIESAGRLGQDLVQVKEEMFGSWSKGRLMVLDNYDIPQEKRKEVSLNLAKKIAETTLSRLPFAANLVKRIEEEPVLVRATI